MDFSIHLSNKIYSLEKKFFQEEIGLNNEVYAIHDDQITFEKIKEIIEKIKAKKKWIIFTQEEIIELATLREWGVKCCEKSLDQFMNYFSINDSLNLKRIEDQLYEEVNLLSDIQIMVMKDQRVFSSQIKLALSMDLITRDNNLLEIVILSDQWKLNYAVSKFLYSIVNASSSLLNIIPQEKKNLVVNYAKHQNALFYLHTIPDHYLTIHHFLPEMYESLHEEVFLNITLCTKEQIQFRTSKYSQNHNLSHQQLKQELKTELVTHTNLSEAYWRILISSKLSLVKNTIEDRVFLALSYYFHLIKFLEGYNCGEEQSPSQAQRQIFMRSLYFIKISAFKELNDENQALIFEKLTQEILSVNMNVNYPEKKLKYEEVVAYDNFTEYFVIEKNQLSNIVIWNDIFNRVIEFIQNPYITVEIDKIHESEGNEYTSFMNIQQKLFKIFTDDLVSKLISSDYSYLPCIKYIIASKPLETLVKVFIHFFEMKDKIENISTYDIKASLFSKKEDCCEFLKLIFQMKANLQVENLISYLHEQYIEKNNLFLFRLPIWLVHDRTIYLIFCSYWFVLRLHKRFISENGLNIPASNLVFNFYYFYYFQKYINEFDSMNYKEKPIILNILINLRYHFEIYQDSSNQEEIISVYSKLIMFAHPSQTQKNQYEWKLELTLPQLFYNNFHDRIQQIRMNDKKTTLNQLLSFPFEKYAYTRALCHLAAEKNEFFSTTFSEKLLNIISSIYREEDEKSTLKILPIELKKILKIELSYIDAFQIFNKSYFNNSKLLHLISEQFSWSNSQHNYFGILFEILEEFLSENFSILKTWLSKLKHQNPFNNNMKKKLSETVSLLNSMETYDGISKVKQMIYLIKIITFIMKRQNINDVKTQTNYSIDFEVCKRIQESIIHLYDFQDHIKQVAQLNFDQAFKQDGQESSSQFANRFNNRKQVYLTQQQSNNSSNCFFYEVDNEIPFSFLKFLILYQDNLQNSIVLIDNIVIAILQDNQKSNSTDIPQNQIESETKLQFDETKKQASDENLLINLFKEYFEREVKESLLNKLVYRFYKNEKYQTKSQFYYKDNIHKIEDLLRTSKEEDNADLKQKLKIEQSQLIYSQQIDLILEAHIQIQRLMMTLLDKHNAILKQYLSQNKLHTFFFFISRSLQSNIILRIPYLLSLCFSQNQNYTRKEKTLNLLCCYSANCYSIEIMSINLGGFWICPSEEKDRFITNITKYFLTLQTIDQRTIQEMKVIFQYFGQFVSKLLNEALNKYEYEIPLLYEIILQMMKLDRVIVFLIQQTNQKNDLSSNKMNPENKPRSKKEKSIEIQIGFKEVGIIVIKRLTCFLNDAFKRYALSKGEQYQMNNDLKIILNIKLNKKVTSFALQDFLSVGLTPLDNIIPRNVDLIHMHTKRIISHIVQQTGNFQIVKEVEFLFKGGKGPVIEENHNIIGKIDDQSLDQKKKNSSILDFLENEDKEKEKDGVDEIDSDYDDEQEGKVSQNEQKSSSDIQENIHENNEENNPINPTGQENSSDQVWDDENKVEKKKEEEQDGEEEVEVEEEEEDESASASSSEEEEEEDEDEDDDIDDSDEDYGDENSSHLLKNHFKIEQDLNPTSEYEFADIFLTTEGISCYYQKVNNKFLSFKENHEHFLNFDNLNQSILELQEILQRNNPTKEEYQQLYDLILEIVEYILKVGFLKVNEIDEESLDLSHFTSENCLLSSLEIIESLNNLVSNTQINRIEQIVKQLLMFSGSQYWIQNKLQQVMEYLIRMIFCDKGKEEVVFIMKRRIAKEVMTNLNSSKIWIKGEQDEDICTDNDFLKFIEKLKNKIQPPELNETNYNLSEREQNEHVNEDSESDENKSIQKLKKMKFSLGYLLKILRIHQPIYQTQIKQFLIWFQEMFAPINKNDIAKVDKAKALNLPKDEPKKSDLESKIEDNNQEEIEDKYSSSACSSSQKEEDEDQDGIEIWYQLKNPIALLKISKQSSLDGNVFMNDAQTEVIQTLADVLVLKVNSINQVMKETQKQSKSKKKINKPGPNYFEISDLINVIRNIMHDYTEIILPRINEITVDQVNVSETECLMFFDKSLSKCPFIDYLININTITSFHSQEIIINLLFSQSDTQEQASIIFQKTISHLLELINDKDYLKSMPIGYMFDGILNLYNNLVDKVEMKTEIKSLCLASTALRKGNSFSDFSQLSCLEMFLLYERNMSSLIQSEYANEHIQDKMLKNIVPFYQMLQKSNYSKYFEQTFCIDEEQELKSCEYESKSQPLWQKPQSYKKSDDQQIIESNNHNIFNNPFAFAIFTNQQEEDTFESKISIQKNEFRYGYSDYYELINNLEQEGIKSKQFPKYDDLKILMQVLKSEMNCNLGSEKSIKTMLYSKIINQISQSNEQQNKNRKKDSEQDKINEETENIIGELDKDVEQAILLPVPNIIQEEEKVQEQIEKLLEQEEKVQEQQEKVEEKAEEQTEEQKEDVKECQTENKSSEIQENKIDEVQGPSIFNEIFEAMEMEQINRQIDDSFNQPLSDDNLKFSEPFLTKLKIMKKREELAMMQQEKETNADQIFEKTSQLKQFLDSDFFQNFIQNQSTQNSAPFLLSQDESYTNLFSNNLQGISKKIIDRQDYLLQRDNKSKLQNKMYSKINSLQIQPREELKSQLKQKEEEDHCKQGEEKKDDQDENENETLSLEELTLFQKSLQIPLIDEQVFLRFIIYHTCLEQTSLTNKVCKVACLNPFNFLRIVDLLLYLIQSIISSEPTGLECFDQLLEKQFPKLGFNNILTSSQLRDYNTQIVLKQLLNLLINLLFEKEYGKTFLQVIFLNESPSLQSHSQENWRTYSFKIVKNKNPINSIYELIALLLKFEESRDEKRNEDSSRAFIEINNLISKLFKHIQNPLLSKQIPSLSSRNKQSLLDIASKAIKIRIKTNCEFQKSQFSELFTKEDFLFLLKEVSQEYYNQLVPTFEEMQLILSKAMPVLTKLNSSSVDTQKDLTIQTVLLFLQSKNNVIRILFLKLERDFEFLMQNLKSKLNQQLSQNLEEFNEKKTEQVEEGEALEWLYTKYIAYKSQLKQEIIDITIGDEGTLSMIFKSYFKVVHAIIQCGQPLSQNFPKQYQNFEVGFRIFFNIYFKLCQWQKNEDIVCDQTIIQFSTKSQVTIEKQKHSYFCKEFTHSNSLKTIKELFLMFQDQFHQLIPIFFNISNLSTVWYKLIPFFPSLELPIEHKMECLKILVDQEINKNVSDDIIREQEFKIDRNQIWMSGLKEFSSISPINLSFLQIEISFEGEDGYDGGGLYREFIEQLFKDIIDPNKGLFRLSADNTLCIPSPISSLIPDYMIHFKYIGRVLAKSLLDQLTPKIDLPQCIIKQILGMNLDLSDLEEIDKELYNNLKWILDNDIERIDQSFTTNNIYLGVENIIELKPNGRNIEVDNNNKQEYVQLLIQNVMVDSIKEQVSQLQRGFYELIPLSIIKILNPQELQLKLSGERKFDMKNFKENIKFISYSLEDQLIIWLFEILEEFSEEQKAAFLFYLTGSSRAPYGGFTNKTPIKIGDCENNAFLPVAHTCTRILNIPRYTSKEVFKSKLNFAIQEGSKGFYIR